MATKRELLAMLDGLDDDACVVCMDENGMWDNIEHVAMDGAVIAIVFGGGSPFRSDK